MATQTIQFETVSIRQLGSGTITAELFSDDTLVATLSTIIENADLDGRYTGTVTDIAAATYRLVVYFDGYTVNEIDEQVTLVLATGTYIAFNNNDSILLDTGTTLPASLTVIDTWVKRNAVVLSGTISTANQATEIYTISSLGITATFSVDVDGNRSSVVWS